MQCHEPFVLRPIKPHAAKTEVFILVAMIMFTSMCIWCNLQQSSAVHVCRFFTAVAVWQLHERGLVDVDADIKQYISMKGGQAHAHLTVPGC